MSAVNGHTGVRTVKRVAAATILVWLLVAAILPAFASGAGNSVTIRVRVSPRTEVTRADDTLVVRSNTGWRVILTTPNSTIEYAGGKTNGEKLEIPASTTQYWVVAE